MRILKYIFMIIASANFLAEAQTFYPNGASMTPCIGEYRKAWFTDTRAYDSLHWVNGLNQIVSKEDTLFITPQMIPSANLYTFDLKLYENGAHINQGTGRLYVIPITGFPFSVSNDTTICLNDTSTIRVYNPTNQTLRYRWHSDVPNFIPPPNTTTTQIKGYRKGKYWVEATNSSQTCTIVDTMYLDIINQPVSLRADFEICDNQPVLLQNLNPEIPGSTHQWRFNNQTANASTLTPTVSGNYVLTVTTPAPIVCTFTDSVSAIINRMPKVDLTNPGSICKGESFVIQNTLSNSGLSYTTSWISNITLPTIPQGQEVISVSETGFYKLVLNTGKCVASDSTTLNVLSFEVDLGKNIPDTCSNSGVTLFNIKANTESGTSFYLWRTPSGSSTSKTLKATQRGMYYLTVTSDNPECQVSDSVFVGISPVPEFELGDDIVEQNSFVIYDGTFSNKFKETDFSFMWKNPSIDSVYADKARLILEKKGTHTLALTVKNNVTKCQFTDNISITIPEDPIVASHVLYIPDAISPNAPNIENSKVKILGPDISNENFEFRIFNRWGEVIFETSDYTFMSIEGWNGESSSASPNGTYTYTTKGQFVDGVTFQEVGTITVLR